jgi:hypothetical protein
VPMASRAIKQGGLLTELETIGRSSAKLHGY